MTSEELQRELAAILGPEGLVVDLEESPASELPEPKVAGILSHPKFQDKELLQRRDLIWPQLRERLGDRAQFVGVLLLFTPDEYAALQAA